MATATTAGGSNVGWTMAITGVMVVAAIAFGVVTIVRRRGSAV